MGMAHVHDFIVYSYRVLLVLLFCSLQSFWSHIRRRAVFGASVVHGSAVLSCMQPGEFGA